MDEAVGKSSPYSEVYDGEAMPERNCSEIYDYSENLEKNLCNSHHDTDFANWMSLNGVLIE